MIPFKDALARAKAEIEKERDSQKSGETGRLSWEDALAKARKQVAGNGDLVEQWFRDVASVTDRVSKYFSGDTYKAPNFDFDVDIDKYLDDAALIGSYIRADQDRYADYEGVLQQYNDTVKYLKDIKDNVSRTNEWYASFTPSEDETAAGYTAEQLYNQWRERYGITIDELRQNLEKAKATAAELRQQEKEAKANYDNYYDTSRDNVETYDFLREGPEKRALYEQYERIRSEAEKADEEAARLAQMVATRVASTETDKYYSVDLAELEKMIQDQKGAVDAARVVSREAQKAYSEFLNPSDGSIPEAFTRTEEEKAEQQSKHDTILTDVTKVQEEQIRLNEMEDIYTYRRDMQTIGNMTELERLALETRAAGGNNSKKYAAWNTATAGINMDPYRYLEEKGYSSEEIKSLTETYSRYLNEQNARTIQLKSESFAQRMPILSTITTYPAQLIGSVTGAVDAVGGIAKNALGLSQYKTLDPNTAGYMPQAYAQGVRGEVSSDMSGAGKILYEAVNSTVDNLLRVAVGGRIGSMALAATSAFGSTVRDVTLKGGTPAEAFLMGIADAGIEALTEKVSVDSLLKISTARNGAELLKNMLLQGVVEMTEEEASFVGSLLAETAILGKDSDFNRRVGELEYLVDSTEEAKKVAYKELFQEAAEIGITSFLSGSFMEGVHGGSQMIGDAAKRRNVQRIQEKISSQLTQIVEDPNGTQPDSSKQVAAVPENNIAADPQEQILRNHGLDVNGNQISTDDNDVVGFSNEVVRSHVSKAVKTQVQAVAEATGRRVIFYEGESSENGRFHDGVIYININGADPLAQVVAHELTHSVEKADIYKDLSQLVLHRIEITGGDLQTMMKAKQDLYARHGKVLSKRAEIEAEIVADYAAKHLFTNLRDIASITKENPSLGRKILNWIDQLLSKLGSKSAQERAFLQKARSLYADALLQTQSSFNVETANSQTFAQQKKPAANSQMNSTQEGDFDQLWRFAHEAYARGEITKEEFDGMLELIEQHEQEQLGGTQLHSEYDAVTEEKHSFVGYAEDGRGIYKSNFPKGTPRKAKGERILQYIQDVWAKKPITLRIEHNGTVRYIEARFDPTYDESENTPTDASKLMGGNRHGTSSEQRVTLDLADDYYQLAAESRYNYSKEETGKTSVTHDDVRWWHYFVNDIYFAEYGSNELVPYTVSINVKERADGNFFYSYSAERSEKNGEPSTQRTLHAVVNSSNEAAADGRPSEDSIDNPNEIVNGQFSFSEQTVNKRDVVNDLREILQRGGDTAELRRYVEHMEQNAGRAEQDDITEEQSEGVHEILAAANAQRLSVDEYLRRNFELYEYDGQLNADARAALDIENRGVKYSISDKEINDIRNIGRKSINSFNSAELQKAEGFAKRYLRELGTKSPFFRAWFGDWRAYDTTPIRVAKVKSGTRGTQKNVDTGWNIQISGQVFNETQVHRSVASREAVSYLPYINDIVENAVLLDSYGLEIGKAKSINSLLMHSMYAVADTGNGPEVLKLHVEEMNNPNASSTSKRAYHLQNIEKAFNASVRVQGNTPSSLTNTSNAVNTVADLCAAVKTLDSNFTPRQVHPELLQPDGKPKVFYHGSAEMFDVFSYGHIGNATGTGILGDGFYFTDDQNLAQQYGENVYQCYLQMSNPYMANQSDAYRLSASALKAKGYDGVILKAPKGTVYMVLNNTQIKSATDNVGTFDGNNPDIRYSITDVNTDNGVREDPREKLPRKARDYLDRAESKLLRSIGFKLGVPKFTRRQFLKEIVQEISNEYLRNGTVAQEQIDMLFERAYAQGIVVDAEFYNTYKHIKQHLRTTAVTISEQDSHDIADYSDFRKRAFGTLRIVNSGGLPVDVAYDELKRMAPELFPEKITHPADQLQHMYEVARSIAVSEKTLKDYYGELEPEYRRFAKNDFSVSIGEVIGELRTVKRFYDERQATDEDEGVPANADQAMEAYAKLKAARREYERVNAKQLLTQNDEIQVGRLLRGEIMLEHLDPEKDNVEGITAVYEAKREYERLSKLLSEYKRKLRADMRQEADKYLQTANEWRDKKVGIAYSRETMERNVEDIVPDRVLAKQINQEYFEPVRDAEAEATRLKNEFRDRVRALGLATKVAKENLVSEAHAVQLLGEAIDNIRVLKTARGFVKSRDGKTMDEWQAVIDNLWVENPNMDVTKIEHAVEEFRKIYDELFKMMNEVRVKNGYEPVNYRQGYFPHFQPGDGDGIMTQFGRLVGIDTRVSALPTTINGLTHTFKPGIQWFGNAQERLGFNTAYDAVEGFDMYIEGVSSVIYQTENIQKLRALASQIRYRTSDEGIRKQVDAVHDNPRLTEEEKQVQIAEIYEHGRFTLSNFVNELDEYTNLLANKKSKLDRSMESLLGRRAYTVMKAWESRVGANMIAGNISSALTNIIPLTQANAQLDSGMLLRGMWGALQSYRQSDGVVDMSSFLTNRRGSDPIVKNWAQKTSAVLSTPMELIDTFVSDSIVRGAYYQNLKNGMSEAEAIHQADIFAARVMAERSKGAMPTLFQSSNPIFKAFTQFQLEVNNQFSEVFKDLPRSVAMRGLGALLIVLLKYFIGAFLFNELYEYFIGRRPALDPIGIINDTIGDLTGYQLPNILEIDVGGMLDGDFSTLETDQTGIGEAGKNLATNILEELPFSSGLTLLGIETDGGRIPVSSAIPDLSAVWDAATTEGWSDEKRWQEIQEELNKLAYVLPPVGGGQVSKMWKGVKAYIEGGSYKVDAEGRETLQYPVYKDNPEDSFWNMVRATIMGKNSLPEAQEWVDSGFQGLNAKQTAAYQDMLEVGVKDRDAFELMMSLQHVKKTDDDSRKDIQCKIISESKISGEGKAVAYYAIVASDSERKIMDDLADAGASASDVVLAIMRIRDADMLKGVEGKKQKLDVILNANLTDEEKIILYRATVTASMDAEIDSFKTAKIAFDNYLRAQDAYESIRTQKGDNTQTALEFYRWVNSCNYTEKQKTVVKDCFTNSIIAKRYDEFHKIAGEYGINSDVYIRLYEALPKYDTNKNGSYSQAEVEAAIDGICGNAYAQLQSAFSGDGRAWNLTDVQKAVLWQFATGSSSAKNNPYSVSVGKKVLASK